MLLPGVVRKSDKWFAASPETPADSKQQLDSELPSKVLSNVPYAHSQPALDGHVSGMKKVLPSLMACHTC